jgi:molybdopterin synthase catalytic subunit/molybdopterin synthase sulfur carrier subunit
MKVEVRLFARAKDLAGSDVQPVELPAGATVAQLRKALAASCQPLEKLLPRCAIAVDDEFVGDDQLVPANGRIALIPPVSGG